MCTTFGGATDTPMLILRIAGQLAGWAKAGAGQGDGGDSANGMRRSFVGILGSSGLSLGA